jgi:hypothetical protein
MAATPKAGFLYFKGLSSGTTYMKAIFNEDVLQTLVRWDNGGGVPATTKGSDFVTFPEAVTLVDAVTITGIVDTKQIKFMADYAPTIYGIYWEAHLTTLNNRPTLNIGFKQGTRISAISTA